MRVSREETVRVWKKFTRACHDRSGGRIPNARQMSHTSSPALPPPPVTDLLLAWEQGDESALQQLIPVVTAELHRLARRYMRGERRDHTLQTTALVNEAYLRLIDVSRVRWQD